MQITITTIITALQCNADTTSSAVPPRVITDDQKASNLPI